MNTPETKLGISFRDPALLERALVHASASQESRDLRSNEQLEFLGDAVLQLIVTEALYLRHPDAPEGRMTRARAGVVSGRHLARRARELGLGPHITLGRGARRSGGQEQPSILADTLEAVIAAVYLDGGLDAARSFVLGLLDDDIDGAMAAQQTVVDAKSRLQELLQARGPVRIDYETTGQQGPPHDRTFTVALRADDRLLSTASGKSKKQAEQKAAEIALKSLENPDK